MAERLGGTRKWPYNQSECLDADFFKVRGPAGAAAGGARGAAVGALGSSPVAMVVVGGRQGQRRGRRATGGGTVTISATGLASPATGDSWPTAAALAPAAVGPARLQLRRRSPRPPSPLVRIARPP